MRNGSRSEYYLVEGGLKMTRVRQSEWRRRWGIQGIIEFDAQVGAGGDDGMRWGGTFATAHGFQIMGRDAGANYYDSFNRFTNVTIPAGATIITAYLTVTVNQPDDDGVGVKGDIDGNDEDDAVAPTTKAEMDALSRTTAKTAWDDVDLGALDAEVNTPSIVDVIQEIVDRPGWASGQAMMLFLEERGSTSTVNKHYDLYTYDGDTAKAVKLHVEYSS